MTTREAVNRSAGRADDEAASAKRMRSPGNSSGGAVRKRKKEAGGTEDYETEEEPGTETKQPEEVEEDRLTSQMEELTPKPSSKTSNKGSRSKQRDSNSSGTHSPTPTDKKLSKNKMKLRARREAKRNEMEIMDKEISAKSREDYLIESRDLSNNGLIGHIVHHGRALRWILQRLTTLLNGMHWKGHWQILDLMMVQSH
ncbi:hypothetical protein ZOSMA_1249G00040 [Zostera marina]|uniref:Uncharacterized protein n=1 Tax=Zostera marina TaxID=29655 RepID=A0A0K9Q057_ZOSMR|nr:hypothetical protein ZOSMA_1249G00040 [Zostera marina]